MADDDKKDSITALETHTDKSLFYRPIPAHIKASLVMIEGESENKRFAMTESPIFIGRDKGMDIFMEDKSLSREHAVIFFYDGRFYIRDLKSTNGTMVNGKRIDQTSLNFRDVVQFGKVAFKFYLEQAEIKTQNSDPGGISETVK
ncbi:MAG TPA: FHA domain-containing protein [bacterium]